MLAARGMTGYPLPALTQADVALLADNAHV